MKRIIITLLSAALLIGCSGQSQQTIPIYSWHGIRYDSAEMLFPMLKESGMDGYIGVYADEAQALTALDLAQSNGILMWLRTSNLQSETEQVVAALKDHPALTGWNIKDEPETWDIPGLGELTRKIQSLDPKHPCYINLYPNWAWEEEKYAEHIETFAQEVPLDFYSFDQYPVTEVDGEIVLRPTWYRNLEEFSAMAARHSKPFWAFALTESHHLGAPSPPAFYPVPTIGHLRLQVFSNLVYGAQAIQYYNFRGIYDKETLEKTPVFDVVKQMNSEIKGLSPVFLGCTVKGVWHMGETIPSHTTRLETMPDKRVESLSVDGEGAVVSLLENKGRTFLAVVNRDCVHGCNVDASFVKKVKTVGKDGTRKPFKDGRMPLDPGDIVIFEL